MNKMNEYIKALKNGKGFEWIAQHGHELDKYDLIDIIKELDCAIEKSIEKEDIYESAAIELKSCYGYEEEE